MYTAQALKIIIVKPTLLLTYIFLTLILLELKILLVLQLKLENIADGHGPGLMRTWKNHRFERGAMYNV